MAASSIIKILVNQPFLPIFVDLRWANEYNLINVWDNQLNLIHLFHFQKYNITAIPDMSNMDTKLDKLSVKYYY